MRSISAAAKPRPFTFVQLKNLFPMSNILIVDDEQSYRQLLSLVFESDGHVVRTAMNGRQALETLQAEPADVIVSDVKMPDIDGIEMLRAVRENQPDLGVILMTAFASVETAREAFKLGADDFIQKPFNNEELKVIVKRTLEKQAIIDSTIPPSDPLESAIVPTLTPGNYTAILRGVNNTTGIAVVEVYALN